MRGDRVEIVVDTGNGGTQTFEISASKNGRRIEVTTGGTEPTAIDTHSAESKDSELASAAAHN